jgi:radical SAM superfamily enzyme YgiQ (UPF0313 family)
VPKDKRARGLRVTVSASSFVPKPVTPFQWYGQDTQESLKAKQQYLKEKFRSVKGVNFNYHTPELSYLEACFSRGDRRLGRVLLAAVDRGCILDGWSDLFSFETWMQAFADAGLDPDSFAYREFGRDEIMPWEHIDSGIDRSFLLREYDRAQEARVTRDCRLGCNGCGLQKWEGVCAYANARHV